jgi:DNA-binding SARP family transcriptional activator
MRFAILGPLRVEGPSGAIELKAHKQRALLALLLLSGRDGAVPVTRLIDALWDQEPPPTAAKALQVNVSQLRRALGAETIVTQPSGYAVRLEPGSLDLTRFEDLVARAAGAPPAVAVELLREALALFRGPPLADVLLYGPAAGEAARLADLRLAALEQRVDLDLERMRDRHGALVTELEALTAEHPYRERFHAQLMLALYRAGRQADALDAYRRARQALVGDLGLEPSPALKRLEAAILAHDPELEIPAPDAGHAIASAAASRAPAAGSPALPLLPAPLLGRADDSRPRPRFSPTPRCGCSRSPGRAASARRASRSSSRISSRRSSRTARASSPSPRSTIRPGWARSSTRRSAPTRSRRCW